jgi:hypothetical protein
MGVFTRVEPKKRGRARKDASAATPAPNNA